MLKRPITYTNPFTEKEVTEEHYFHISKADLVKMELEAHGATYSKDGEELTGMQAKLQRIVDSEDGKAIMAEFEDIIRRSYGKREGEKFLKSKEISDEFMATEAYSQLFWELCTQADKASEFIQGVVPGNLDQIAADVRKQAELIAAGREAQDAAKAAAGTPEGAIAEAAVEANGAGLDTSAVTESEEDAVRRAAIEEGAVSHDSRTLAERVASATAENPVTLTQAEIAELDSDDLKSGLATGRIKFS